MIRRQPLPATTTVFIDTGGYFASAAPDDPNHAEARSILAILAGRRYRTVTTRLVLAETHTLLRVRLRHRGRHVALAIARDVLAGIAQSTVTIEQIQDDDAEAALATLYAFPDQEISYTDAVSFAVMRRLGVAYVFSFDDDFAVAGFTNIRHVV